MKADGTKAEHKASAEAVKDKGAYEETAFGRRHISKIPKWLATLIWLVRTPILLVSRCCRGSRSE
jgi:hypothetical protein